MGRFFSITNTTGVVAGSERSSRRGAVWTILTVLVLAGLFPSALFAQAPVPEDEWNRGYHGFAAFCRAIGLRTVTREQWSAAPPEESLLVVLGSFNSYAGFDVESYVSRGGALLVATDRGLPGAARLRGITAESGILEAAHRESWFQEFADCPVVASFEDHHPLTDRLLSVATNRPGAIYPFGRFAGASWRTLAWLPELRNGMRDDLRAGFLASVENRARGKGEGRTTMLLLDDRSAVSPPPPEEVEVDIPPPSPEEVREALGRLPPDVLVPFANSVIASVEDTGILDELLGYVVQRIPPLHYRRLLMAIATCCLAIVMFRKLVTESVAEKSATEDEPPSGEVGRRWRARLARQHAAQELLERFRADVAETSAVPWPVFVSRLRLNSGRMPTWLLRYRLRRASRRLAPASFRYWTRWRLRQLDSRVNTWRHLRAAGELEYKNV
jgi:hypothetical protein